MKPTNASPNVTHRAEHREVASDDQRGRLRPPAPPAQWAGERPVIEADERWRNVKPPRTTSGEKRLQPLNDWREGQGGSSAPSLLREEEQSSLGRPARARQENCSDDERLQRGHRAASESVQEKTKRKDKAPGAASSLLEASIRELQSNDEEEREARENKQWRKRQRR